MFFLPLCFPAFFSTLKSMSRSTSLLFIWKNWTVLWQRLMLQLRRGLLSLWHLAGQRQNDREWAEINEKTREKWEHLSLEHLLSLRTSSQYSLAITAAWKCQKPLLLWDIGFSLVKAHLDCNSTSFSELHYINSAIFFSWVKRVPY